MGLRKLAIIGVIICAASSARADVALGVFVGQPTGLDLKLGLTPRSGLDLLLGWDTYADDRTGYFHATYLVTVAVGRGDAVLVPLRIGIGGAVFGPSDDLRVAVRVPLEVALRFRRTPLELYGEIALRATVIDDDNYPFAEVDGG